METLIASTKYNPNKYQILCENEPQQGIQFILNFNNSVVINSQYVSYFSEGIIESNLSEKTVNEELLLNAYEARSKMSNNNNDKENSNKKEAQVLNGFINLKTYDIKSNSYIKYTNNTKELKYIGAGNNGKIMTINPLLYKSLFVNRKNILAFTSNIKLSGVINQSKLLYPMRPRVAQEFMMVSLKEVSKIESIMDMDSNSNPYFAGLYLQSPELLIEKRLGKGESIVINEFGLLAFEGSVKFSYFIDPKNKFRIRNNFILVEGPGLLLFNMTKSQPTSRFTKEAIMLIIFILLLMIFVLPQILEVLVQIIQKIDGNLDKLANDKIK